MLERNAMFAISPIPLSTNEIIVKVLQVDQLLDAVMSSPIRMAFSALLACRIAITPIIPPMQEKMNPTIVATIERVFQFCEGWD